MQVHASKRRRKPPLRHVALQQPVSGLPRRTAQHASHKRSQGDCRCWVAPGASGSNSYSGTREGQDTTERHVSVERCCTAPHTCPRQRTESCSEQGRSHYRGVKGRPTAQHSGIMPRSGALLKSQLERPRQMPEHVSLHKRQPQAVAKTADAESCCQCRDSESDSESEQHQASMALSEKNDRHRVKARSSQVQQLSAMPDVKADRQDPMAQGGHAQLLADVNSFMASLQRPTQALGSTSQPMHAATAGGPVPAEEAENTLPSSIKPPRAMLDGSSTDEGTATAGFVSRCRSASDGLLWDLKSQAGSLGIFHSTEQQPMEGDVDDSDSYSKPSSPAAREGEGLYQQQEGHIALKFQHDGEHSTKGVSAASQLGMLRHQGRTFAETDEAVHKLHDLENTAQASLDELESLLREQQLKVCALCVHHDNEQDLLASVNALCAQLDSDSMGCAECRGSRLTVTCRVVQLAGMGLLPGRAARLGQHTSGSHVQHPRGPHRSVLHAMAGALP